MDNKEMQRLVQQAEDLCEEEKYQKALSIGEKLVAQWPNEMLPYYVRGRARWGEKVYQEALADLDIAISKNPDFAKAWHYRGNVLCDLKQYEEALECFNHAILLDPEFIYAYNSKSIVLMNINRLEEALDCYNRSIQIDAKNVNAFHGKGLILKEMKRYKEALEHYNCAIRLDPVNTKVLNNKGVVLLEMKRYKEALECFDQVIRIDSKFAAAYNNKGNVLSKMYRYEEALESFSHAIRLDSEYANAYNGKGNALYYLKRYEDALECFSHAIRIDPYHVGAFIGKGSVLDEMKRYEEALESYNQAIKLDPKSSNSYNGRGITLKWMKRYEEALESYDRAIHLDHENAPAYNNKGNVLREMKRYEEALEFYNQAIALEKNGVYFRNRAILYEDLDRYDDALADYEKDLEIEPENASAQFLRKRLLNKMALNLIPEQNEEPDEEDTSSNDEEWKERAKRAVERFVEEEESDGLFPEGEKEDLDSMLIQRIQQYHHERQQIDIEKKVEKNKQAFERFTMDQRKPDDLLNPEFYVLRRWNSYTPIVTHNNGASKGGGYFLHMGTSGVVIDPGFNFIENFQEWGFSFSQISKVFISHAHNDHDADLESILTLLHVCNKDIKKKIAKKLIDEVLYGGFPNRDSATENEIYQYIKREKGKRFNKERKVVDLYLTASAFKKHAAWLELRRDNEYRVYIIKPGETAIELWKGASIRPICAKHFDLMSDCDAVGFVIEFPNLALVYTGDTGYSPEIAKKYKELKDDLKDKKHIILLAHIGGFKPREKAINKESLSSGKAFYKDHLGRNGLICLADILRPHCCIISEFGEEFAGFRDGVAKLFTKTFKDSGIRFLPADIGLCINSNMEILAIKGTRYLRNRVVLENEFMDLSDIHITKLEDDSLIYHHRSFAAKKGEIDRLREDLKKVQKIGEQLRPKHETPSV